MKNEYKLIIRNGLILIIFVKFLIVGTVPEFYYSDGDKKSWYEARHYCESRGMELAMLDTEEKYDAAKDYINGYRPKENVWTGLKQYKSCVGSQYEYRYLNGLQPGFIPWHSGKEPTIQDESCVQMHKGNNKFCTKPCLDQNSYLCTSLLDNQATQQIDTTVNIACNSGSQQTDSTTTAEYDTTTNQIDDTTAIDPHSTATITTKYTGSTNPPDSTTVTTIDDTTPEQSQHGGLLDCLCPCSNYTNKWLYLIGNNFTLAELKRIMQPDLDEMADMLKIDYKNTSRYRRSVTSADDSRNSSFTMGMVGVVVISSIVCFFILIDCSNVVATSNNKRKRNVVGVNEM